MKKYQIPTIEVTQTRPIRMICDTLAGGGAFETPNPGSGGGGPNAAPYRFPY